MTKPMLSVSRSAVMNVPPDRVYETFVDVNRWLEWVPHFRTIRPLQNGPLTLGSRAEIRTRFTPVSGIWSVTAMEPGRSFAWTYSSLPGLRLTVDHIAEHDGCGTKVTLRLDVEGALSYLAAPAALLLSRRNFDQSLLALKRMLEGEAQRGEP